MRFLLSFSDRFALAVGVWPFASIALTLPILAFLYHRDGRLRAWSAVGAYLSVLYALSLVCFTLWPLPSGESGLGITYGVAPQLNPLGFVHDLAKDGLAAVPQILLNVVFFMPFGFILARGFGWGVRGTVGLGLAASLLIETAQLTGLFGIYPYAYRTFDVDDLVWNTSGAALGWWAAQVVARVVPPAAPAGEEPTHSPGFLRRTVALALDLLLLGTAWVVVVAGAQLVLLALGASVGEGVLGTAQSWAFRVGFVVLEGVVPWVRGGQTPGGGFVRMSFETRERHGARRVAFYLARLACLAFAPMLWPVYLVFYLVARKMPYDFL